ncbi:MAG: flagellar basal body P-ring protein FlgI [Deltaproteobacteria bacterium]|nr:MAG: flagellar basal body P-ring protein FlgI [Deltaproteobacteria bacterium]
MRPDRYAVVTLAVVLAAGVSGPPRLAAAAPVRIKDLAQVEGMRDNVLYGYGLVVGLPGTGDTARVFFTHQSISSMLGRLGIRVDPREVRVRNVAAVMVTARLPNFARPGARIDVEVSSLGNARSLAGGVLLATPLQGPDGKTYAVAQGPVQAGGFDVRARGSRVSYNMPTTGRVPGGGTIEVAVRPKLDGAPLRLALKEPDFTTAIRMAEAIEAEVGEGTAKAVDPATVEVTVPQNESAMQVMARIEGIEVDADQRARVVISERTGTVVAGAHVRIREVAVAHGSLRISIERQPVISQPPAGLLGGGRGRTVRDETNRIRANEAPAKVVHLPAATTVADLVAALNALGARPRDLIAILQAMKAAGALDADLEVI